MANSTPPESGNYLYRSWANPSPVTPSKDTNSSAAAPLMSFSAKSGTRSIRTSTLTPSRHHLPNLMTRTESTPLSPRPSSGSLSCSFAATPLPASTTLLMRFETCLTTTMNTYF
ncbi:unnamed protein product [Ixodes pacificus]